MSEYDDLGQGNSVVFSFRLNAADPFEAQALDYLRREQERGKKTRRVIAEALVQAGQRDSTIERLVSQQELTIEILERLEGQGITVALDGGQRRQEDAEGDKLSDELRAGLIQHAPKMITLDD